MDILSRIKEVSQYTVLFSFVLYFFGYITISSYYSRFGIASYEIINIRFILSGILSLLPVMLVCYGAYEIYSLSPKSLIFTSRDIKKRVAVFGMSLLGLYSASIALKLIYGASIIDAHRVKDFTFQPFFGTRDIVGRIVNSIIYSKSADFMNNMKYALYFGIYLVIIVILAVLIKRGIDYLVRDKHVSREEREGQQNKIYKHNPVFIIWVYRIVECLLIGTFISLVLYSFQKLHSNIFNIESISPKLSLDESIIFPWMFITFITLYSVFWYIDLNRHGSVGKAMRELNFGSVLSISSYIALLIGSLFLFGQTIYPRIPYEIGGGQPRVVSVETSKDGGLNIDYRKKVFLLGESKDFIFIIIEDENIKESFQIKKDEVVSIRTKSSLVE